MSPRSLVGEAPTEKGSDLQFLTFLLAGEEYGVDILKVQEIKGYSAVTAIPHTPVHVKGVMNLRGVVVPVIDLRPMLGLEAAAVHGRTVVIVVNVGDRVLALVVDAVSDVLEVAPGQLEPCPELGVRIDTSFVTGLAKRSERMVILLNVEKLLRGDELRVLGS